MAKISDIRSFVVEGRGEFPFDMLRYDRCWPASGRDAAMLATDGGGHDRRRVELRSADGQVTVARWNSFLWGVIETRH